MLKNLIVFLSIIILFYIINNFILKKNINEHYLTYFLPFYNRNSDDLANFYNNDENNLNYFKKKFNYQDLNIGTNYSEEYFIKSLIKKKFIKYRYCIISISYIK